MKFKFFLLCVLLISSVEAFSSDIRFIRKLEKRLEATQYEDVIQDFQNSEGYGSLSQEKVQETLTILNRYKDNAEALKSFRFTFQESDALEAYKDIRVLTESLGDDITLGWTVAYLYEYLFFADIFDSKDRSNIMKRLKYLEYPDLQALHQNWKEQPYGILDSFKDFVIERIPDGLENKAEVLQAIQNQYENYEEYLEGPKQYLSKMLTDIFEFSCDIKEIKYWPTGEILSIISEEGSPTFRIANIANKDVMGCSSSVVLRDHTLAQTVCNLKEAIAQNPWKKTPIDLNLNATYGIFNGISPHSYMNTGMLPEYLSGKNVGVLCVEPVYSMPKDLKEEYLKEDVGLEKIFLETRFSSYVEEDPLLGRKSSSHAENVLSVVRDDHYTPDTHLGLIDLKSFQKGNFDFSECDIINHSWGPRCVDNKGKRFLNYKEYNLRG